jgi:hypothetical protein
MPRDADPYPLRTLWGKVGKTGSADMVLSSVKRNGGRRSVVYVSIGGTSWEDSTAVAAGRGATSGR